MSQTDQAARDALRACQGAGARYDAPAAPHDDLLLVRRGTAFFARRLNALTDADLGGPTLLPGINRCRLIADISYQARQFAHMAEIVRTGKIPKEYAMTGSREDEVALAATLPARALRHLFEHSVVHLNVEWRDLTDADWDKPVELPGHPAARDLPGQRARTIWHAGVQLANGARESDIPDAIR